MREQELKDKLYDNPNNIFVYRKLDGSNRIAEGTRQTGDFSDQWDESRDVVTYWDNVKGDYRCFRYGNLITIIQDKSQPVMKVKAPSLIDIATPSSTKGIGLTGLWLLKKLRRK